MERTAFFANMSQAETSKNEVIFWEHHYHRAGSLAQRTGALNRSATLVAKPLLFQSEKHADVGMPLLRLTPLEHHARAICLFANYF